MKEKRYTRYDIKVGFKFFNTANVLVEVTALVVDYVLLNSTEWHKKDYRTSITHIVDMLNKRLYIQTKSTQESYQIY